MTRRHRNWLDDYLATVVSRSEAPARFHFWAGCSVIGGALRRHVYIDMETFQWYPNLYVLLVGPPGIVKKSTTINIGARLLRDVEGVKFGADITTWEGFIEQLDQSQEIYSTGGGDTLVNSEATTACSLTMTISEWGTF